MATMFIFLDESGDLGFDWKKPGTSSHFVITLLVCESHEAVNSFKVAVRRTLRQKLNTKNCKRRIHELKGASTTIEVKRYFSRHVPDKGWGIYSIALNKRRAYEHLQTKVGKKKLYNFLARFLIEKLPFATMSPSQVNLVLDRCKNKEEIKDFNSYIEQHLQGILPLEVPLFISHESSAENPCLQAVDLFCWGIARNWRDGDNEWLKEFVSAVRYNERYL